MQPQPTATTGLRLKFISLILLVFLMITWSYKTIKKLWAAQIQIISIVFGTNIYIYISQQSILKQGFQKTHFPIVLEVEKNFAVDLANF